MSKFLIIGLVITIVSLIVIFAWFYLFNIYEVKILVTSNSLKTNSDSKIEIVVIPLNSFGSNALFRNIFAKFELLSGKELIKMERKSKNAVTIYSKGKTGIAEILVTPSIGLYPTKVEIKVE